MPPSLDRRLRPRLTLRQIGVLVVFAAVASAVAMPQFRGSTNTGETIFAVAVEVPYVLILPAVFLIRRGPLKNWLTAALCCMPIVVFLIYVNQFWHVMLPGLVVLGVVDLVLAGFLTYFLQWLVPRTCPTCGRWAMLRDALAPGSRRFVRKSEPRTCLACGSRFRREPHGPWVDVDEVAYSAVGGSR